VQQADVEHPWLRGWEAGGQVLLDVLLAKALAVYGDLEVVQDLRSGFVRREQGQVLRLLQRLGELALGVVVAEHKIVHRGIVDPEIVIINWRATY